MKQNKNLKEQYNALKYMVENGIDTDSKKCKENYLTTVLYSILSMAVKVDQTYIPDKIEEVKKVIKVRRFNIPVEVIRKTHPDLVVFEGVYLIVDGLFLPKEVMKDIGYYTMNEKNGVLDTSSLPKGYSYSTIKEVEGGYGFVLKKDDVSDCIGNRASAYEYFSVSDYIF